MAKYAYYAVYPRDFANEYTIYVCPAEMESELREALGERAEKQTRLQAIMKGYRWPRESINERPWHGAFYGCRVPFAGYDGGGDSCAVAYRKAPEIREVGSASEALTICERATVAMLR